MTRVLLVAGLMSVVSAQAQAPGPVQIQNGRIETRAGAAIDREIAAASAPGSTEPVWIAWRTPMIAGDRDMCGWYSDRLGTVRGISMDEDFRSPQIVAPKGPVPLEAGTGLVVLVRAVGGKVERLRTLGDDCPIDAGGRSVFWLSSITPAESLRFLNGLTRPIAADRSMFDQERQLASSAVRAMGFHADGAADAMLDTLAASHTDSSVRHQAATTLTAYRGAHGAATVTRLIGTTKDNERRSLVTALGQSREPSTTETFRSLTRDADAGVRSEAAHYLVVRGGAQVIPEAMKLATSDADASLRKRVLSDIARLPGNAGIASLIDLARTTQNAAIRKDAVSALSQSTDSRAIAFMEEILKR